MKEGGRWGEEKNKGVCREIDWGVCERNARVTEKEKKERKGWREEKGREEHERQKGTKEM